MNNRPAYLAQTNGFIAWLSRQLDESSLAHRYTNRRTQQPWHCDSLLDAYQRYAWPHPAVPRLDVEAGTSYASNARALAALQQDLRAALCGAGNDEAACRAACDVMRWGGVASGNIAWLQANTRGLAQLLIRTRDALNAGDTAASVLRDSTLRFNAGMTKVYSLICDDFIIYDSRVAAALGWAVVKYCEAQHQPASEALLYPWAPAKETKDQRDPKRRNPSKQGITFPRLRSGAMHAQWNLKASWLLRAVLDRAKESRSAFVNTDPLRALEAALFMIGYDLPDMPAVAAKQVRLPEDEWIECMTPARAKPFSYQVTPAGIKIAGGPLFSDRDIDATLNDVWARVAHRPFALANGAVSVRRGMADPNGLGTAYFAATRQNPPDTSRLAAVLEEIGALVRHVSYAKGPLQWTLNLGQR